MPWYHEASNEFRDWLKNELEASMVHMKGPVYQKAKESGATPDEISEAYESDLNMDKYSELRKQGVEHQEAMKRLSSKWYHEATKNFNTFVHPEQGTITCPMCGERDLKRKSPNQYKSDMKFYDSKNDPRPIITIHQNDEGKPEFSEEEQQSGIFLCSNKPAHGRIYFPFTRAKMVQDGTPINKHIGNLPHPAVETTFPYEVKDAYYVHGRGLATCPECNNHEIAPVRPRRFQRMLEISQNPDPSLPAPPKVIAPGYEGEENEGSFFCDANNRHPNHRGVFFTVPAAHYFDVPDPSKYTLFGAHVKESARRNWYNA